MQLYKLYVEVQKDVKAQRFLPVVSFPELCSGSRQPQELGGGQQQQQQLDLSTSLAGRSVAAGEAA